MTETTGMERKRVGIRTSSGGQLAGRTGVRQRETMVDVFCVCGVRKLTCDAVRVLSDHDTAPRNKLTMTPMLKPTRNSRSTATSTAVMSGHVTATSSASAASFMYLAWPAMSRSDRLILDRDLAMLFSRYCMPYTLYFRQVMGCGVVLAAGGAGG